MTDDVELMGGMNERIHKGTILTNLMIRGDK
jgi:hypothetical protein